MSRKIDTRTPGDHPQNTVTPLEQGRGLAATPDGLESGAAAPGGDYVQRALDYLQGRPNMAGLEALNAAPAPKYVPDPQVQVTSSGAHVVHAQPQHYGIDIFEAAATVRFAPGDRTGPEMVEAGIPHGGDTAPVPTLTAERAVGIAATTVANLVASTEEGATDPFGELLAPARVDMAGFAPELIKAFPDQPSQPAVFAAGPFGDEIQASLIWFPRDGALHLGWEVILTLPDLAGRYRVIVHTQTGEVLYAADLTHTARRVRGNVFRVSGAGPRETVDFPPPLTQFGLPVPGDLPREFPDAWVAESTAAGNAVNIRLMPNGSVLRGTTQGDVLLFDPADPNSTAQLQINLFYYNCFMHDFFYLLGFRERDGSFQQDNFGRGGLPGDAVEARVHPGPVYGTANMLTPVDGRAPVMNMGLVTRTGRHTALDSSVVFHEYTHGVTNRLVGGRVNTHALEADQSAGMGEGWGDYIACTINNSVVVGAWVVHNAQGLRTHPYTSDYPGHFGLLGQGIYSEVHNIGEIWCATLLEINRRIGKNLALQLVVDALKLSPANPSFLDMRDAILLALDHKQTAAQITPAVYTAARRELLAVFAHFGMGPAARSLGATLFDIVADFGATAAEDSPAEHVDVLPAENGGVAAAPGTNGAYILSLPPGGSIRRLTLALEFQQTDEDALYVRVGMLAVDDQTPGPNHG